MTAYAYRIRYKDPIAAAEIVIYSCASLNKETNFLWAEKAVSILTALPIQEQSGRRIFDILHAEVEEVDIK